MGQCFPGLTLVTPELPWPQTQKEQGRPLPAQALVPGPGLDPGGPNSFPARMSNWHQAQHTPISTPSSLSLLHPQTPRLTPVSAIL